ncbi:beta-ketoacyl-[acyl-carrier-protein] synthase family protein [Stratiformator vulcanicus]|uniref:3-oxoacyl-[acyl-carrier-protein] synthase 2 n=1 Tax=Stratiformator vulcanicus TaxID=2527980 RepID=A0A517R1B4_9PLAN|nr:beta-ketoacyl-[acyl-carrier-protein] synthase family protein [Stratiformator vulcanicus]QDT37630.1 3-oxoacyl-[acyl-carrier-protein] synthase 2 [Stratiformator vulcanicus]
MTEPSADRDRIVITGIGLTSPNGNTLDEYRANLLRGESGVQPFETRYMPPVIAGVCDFDALKYQKRKEIRRGTRAGSVAVYCANEAVRDSGLDWENVQKNRVGVYIGITEHGNVETENEIYEISQFDYDTKVWSHHHNPRTVANNAAGEVTLSLRSTGPHLTIGAACAAGNAGFIQGVQMLRLGEVDLAIAGGVSESIHTFGIFASFQAQGALAHHEDPALACRPFDAKRNGIVVAEGGGLVTLERLSDAKARGARIYGEIVGYAMNSDAKDFVLPDRHSQEACVRLAMERAQLGPEDIQIVSSHATATEQGDIEEATALGAVFGDSPKTHINNTKSFIGHAMGAAGALELLGNLPSFQDEVVHATINLDEQDSRCPLENVVANEPRRIGRVDHILNNSFGMLGINSVVIVRRPPE